VLRKRTLILVGLLLVVALFSVTASAQKVKLTL